MNLEVWEEELQNATSPPPPRPERRQPAPIPKPSALIPKPLSPGQSAPCQFGHALRTPGTAENFSIQGLGGYEVGFIFLVSPKGHQVYTLTNIETEPYIHSPITVISTLLHMSLGCRVGALGFRAWGGGL